MADDAISDPANLESHYKIIIIGAGISGLATAVKLSKEGENDFRVLEARNRIGGRILTTEIGGAPQELGARWIHGVLSNPIYDLAIKNGLIKMKTETDNHAVVATTEDGKRIPIKIVEEVYSAYFWFCKRCEEYFSLRLSPPIETGNSVGKHIEMDIKPFLDCYQGEDRKVRRMIFDHLLNRETCITGCDSMNQTGLGDFGSYTELPGGNVTIPSGYSSLLEILTQDLPRESILKEQEVVKISWHRKVFHETTTDEVLETYSEVPDRSLIVECADGRRYLARHVVVTLPLGVLKQNCARLFNPPLPDYKLDCIRRLCFGVVNKIFLEYDRPFLNPNITEIITLWNSTAEHSDIKENWFRKIYSFYKVNDNVLLAWVSGVSGEYLENLGSEEIADTCTKALRKFLCDPYIPMPCRVLCTSWSQDPFSCGSYTSIGVEGSQKDIEMLRKPIYLYPYHNKPALLFAGEATHPTFYSTVHGAYLSGQKAAELLLDSDAETQLRGPEEIAQLSSWVKGIDLT